MDAPLHRAPGPRGRRNAPSLSAALRHLGLRPAGVNHRSLKKLIAFYGISTEHFDPNWVLRGPRPRRAIPLPEILVAHSNYHRGNLKRRLYDAGIRRANANSVVKVRYGLVEQWR